MRVKVCDALCGAGKTSASIKMMNTELDKRFIFVTQYISETERIQKACPKREFVLPTGDLGEGLTKLRDIHALLAAGENIATTHSLFVSFTDETKELIKKQKYVLVLDEVVDVMCMSDIKKNDINILFKSQSIVEDDNCIKWINDEYDEVDGGKFREEMLRAKSKNLLKYDDEYFFWSIPAELFECFANVYVLTYMFDAQVLKYFFDMHNIEYELIGTHRVDDGFEFCSIDKMDRKRELRDKIHILDHKKVNAIGDKRTALSFSWYRKAEAEGEGGGIETLRKHISNVFRNIFKTSGSDMIWSTFKDYRTPLSSKGLIEAFVSYNKRACNDYANRHYLAYCVNNFPRPWEVKYFREHGVEVNCDMYALSILVQWIFRSAIRNGEEIWIYLPSARMRAILTQWLDNLAEGKDLEPVKYTAPRKNYYAPKSKNKK